MKFDKAQDYVTGSDNWVCKTLFIWTDVDEHAYEFEKKKMKIRSYIFY